MSRAWLAVVLLLISTPARATTLSDGGNGFLDFSCSSAPTAFDCARYPYGSSGGSHPVTAEARVDSLGGVDADFFDQGVFGIFFLPGPGLTAFDPYVLLLPEVTGEVDALRIELRQVEGRSDPYWVGVTLFEITWDPITHEWSFSQTPYGFGVAPAQLAGDRVLFAIAPTSGADAFGSIGAGLFGTGTFSLRDLRVDPVPAPGAALLLPLAAAFLGTMRATRARTREEARHALRPGPDVL